MATNFFINQSIVIHQVKIGGVSNSSIFQIGSAGVIKSLSNLNNTGGFVGPAPESSAEIQSGTVIQPGSGVTGPLVPLKAR
ncbi:spore germination protein PB [Bacillus tianshenii]|uniref:Spore germination protein PB n=1 Tax=Sutcliffiella tianshenii TaxID=1463404 RepID=A0ABS2P159_9BACI|nr:spore germination protein GerPB [Bacillus tianshenii]MBM7620695.1 spore germination protein PB [Bacillus tianshenii]MCA1320143.1 spore germination protein GerPB [Bacillus tianshenii]